MFYFLQGANLHDHTQDKKIAGCCFSLLDYLRNLTFGNAIKCSTLPMKECRAVCNFIIASKLPVRHLFPAKGIHFTT